MLHSIFRVWCFTSNQRPRRSSRLSGFPPNICMSHQDGKTYCDWVLGLPQIGQNQQLFPNHSNGRFPSLPRVGSSSFFNYSFVRCVNGNWVDKEELPKSLVFQCTVMNETHCRWSIVKRRNFSAKETIGNLNFSLSEFLVTKGCCWS